MALVCLLPARGSAQVEVPAPYRVVLERRGVAFETLRARGFALRDQTLLQPDGAPITPEELERLLALPAARPIIPAPRPPLALPKLTIELTADGAGLFDGAAAPPAAAVAALPKPAPGPVSRDARELAKRFVADETSETGLSEEAPEALRLLTELLHAGQGGPEAPAVLRRMLSKVAELSPERKEAFASRLESPLTVYVALSRSRAPHALESRLYFRRMTELLDAEGKTLSAFIRETDPKDVYAAEFLLRAHAYDSLIPYLNANPDEAAAVVEFLFADAKPRRIREHAAQLEGLMTQLALQGRRSGALDRWVGGLVERAAAAPPPVARRAALFLAVNAALLPMRLRPDVEAVAGLVPEGLLEDAGLVPSDPKDDWPTDQWRFAMHFASTDSYRSWLRSVRAVGWTQEPSAEGLEVSKRFGALEVRVHAALYPGDKEGFLRGAESRRFLAGVARDLKDPAVQGVILRNHAQFRILNLFGGKKVSPGKLLVDGACRSAWDLQELRRKCPTCRFVVNTGTGYGAVNTEAVLAVVEGLAKGDGWSTIGEAWARRYPISSARIQGPWTPPFDEALRLLEQREAAEKSS